MIKYPEATLFSFALKLNIDGEIILDRRYVTEQDIRHLQASNEVDLPYSQIIEMLMYLNEEIIKIEKNLERIK